MTLTAPVDGVRVASAPPVRASSEQFRAFFRGHAAGVAIVTASAHGEPVGFTASSLASVSGSPPLISFNVSRTSSSWATLHESAHVAVHRLSTSDAELAAAFARSGAVRFRPGEWEPGAFGVPVVRGPRAWLVAGIVQRVPAGDSAVLVAEVLSVHGEPTAPQEPGRARPLVYAAGGYAVAVPLGDRP